MITGEAGWTPDQWGHSRFNAFNTSTDSAMNQKNWTAFMRSLLKASLHAHTLGHKKKKSLRYFSISSRVMLVDQQKPLIHEFLLQNTVKCHQDTVAK